MCLVLELKQPLLLYAIHIDIDKYRACVILLALLQVVEYARLLQITCTDCRKLHQTEALLLSAELLTYAAQSLQRLLQLLLEERLVDCYLLNLGCKSSVAAVVAPIGIEYAKLGLRWVALLTLVILHYLTQIIGIHCQTILLAEWLQLLILERDESVQDRHRLHLGTLHIRQLAQILTTRLHCIDVVTLDASELLIGEGLVENQQFRALDADIGCRLYQAYTRHSRACSLVKLSRQILYC